MELSALIREIDGKKISDLSTLQFQHKELVQDITTEIMFLIEGFGPVRLYASSDGETLAWNSAELTPVDMGSDGRFVITTSDAIEFSVMFIMQVVVGSRVYVKDGKEIGLEMKVSNGSFIQLANNGDTLILAVNVILPFLDE